MEEIGIKLKPRQLLFIKSYTTIGSPTYKNAAASIRFAGYKAKNPSDTANNMLKNPRISDAIAELDRQNWDWTLDQWLNAVVNSEKDVPASHSNKPRYLELIAKAKGFISENRTNNNLFIMSAEDFEAIRNRMTSNKTLSDTKSIEAQAVSNPNANDSKDLGNINAT